MTEVSSTRLYLGNLPRQATKVDIENHFKAHGTGEIAEIKLMSGFGFIEYKDPMDARDVVPAFHGSTLLGERLTVQFARGSRHREGGFGTNERSAPRPRRTPHRMQITGLPGETSWQDLKDFARKSGLDVVYSETGRNGNGEGFVEFETAEDLTTAVSKLDGLEFKDKVVSCVANTQPDVATRDNRGRSRSPAGRRPYPAGREEYDRRGPPRSGGGGSGGGGGGGGGGGYSPRWEGYREGYRDRSPRRDYYEDRARYGSPPRRPPVDDYPPPRRYDDPYRRDYPPADPYANGRGPYDRPPPPRDFPPRDAGYPREGGYGPREYGPGRY